VKLDLGFRVRQVLAGPPGQLEAGAVVEARRSEVGAFAGGDGTRHDLVAGDGSGGRRYTYGARVLRVVDGDTLWAEIDCGFGVSIEEKLRLRGIDAPEMSTPEGERARAFVEESLRDCPTIVLATSTTDLYDRYVADVVYLSGVEEPQRILGDGQYLNGELLSAGMAERWG
jgi:endonuclease YncB( thermonuclease family)